MKNFEKLDAFRKGSAEGDEVFVAELKAKFTDMLNCADEMLDTVPDVVMRDIAVCTEFVEISSKHSAEKGQSYGLSYVTDGNDDEYVAVANENQCKRLNGFKDFLLKRYGFDWAYTQIYFTENLIYLNGEIGDKEPIDILLKHFEKAFPNMELGLRF